MRREVEERKQWHPVLGDGLRYYMGARLLVDPEFGLADLPTRADSLLAQPVGGAPMEFPYNHLGPNTLIELVGPGKWVNWRRLCKVYVDGALFRLGQAERRPRDVALWLIASRVSERFRGIVEEELGAITDVAPGLWQASYVGSTLSVIDLGRLPLTVPALPLLMAYKGPREKEIVAFVLQHAREYPFFFEQAVTFHGHAIKEVLAEMRTDIEAYRKLARANVKDIVDLLGPRIIVEEMGADRLLDEMDEKKVIRKIGEEKIIREIGEERVVDDLLAGLGADRLRELVDRKVREREGNGKSSQS